MTGIMQGYQKENECSDMKATLFPIGINIYGEIVEKNERMK
jgi:hypothetical protein